jgi:hypothetical protein
VQSLRSAPKLVVVGIMKLKLETSRSKHEDSMPTPGEEACDQSQSKLFGLPTEIRQKIWQEALRPSTDLDAPAHAAHFHIYDELYTSCTYRPDPVRGQRRANGKGRAALLRTCKVIHNEAACIMYDDKLFQLFVYNGIARINAGLDSVDRARLQDYGYTGPLHRSSGIFKRMKRVTIIVQPCRKADISKYAQRLRTVAMALAHSPRPVQLCVTFCFDEKFKRGKRVCSIVQALSSLAAPGRADRELLILPQVEKKDDCAAQQAHSDLLRALSETWNVVSGDAQWQLATASVTGCEPPISKDEELEAMVVVIAKSMVERGREIWQHCKTVTKSATTMVVNVAELCGLVARAAGLGLLVVILPPLIIAGELYIQGRGRAERRAMVNHPTMAWVVEELVEVFADALTCNCRSTCHAFRPIQLTFGNSFPRSTSPASFQTTPTRE